MTYRALTTAAAALAFALFVCLLLAPGLVVALFAVPGSPGVDFLARRAALLFLGLAVLAVLTRDFVDRVPRQAVAASIAVTMGGLGALGLVEFVRGFAGPGILLAVAGELALTVGYVRVLRRDRTRRP